MDVAEPLEQLAPIARERPAVRPNHVTEELLHLVDVVGVDFLDRDDQRRVADDPQLSVDHFRQLAERLDAVLRPALGDVRLEPLPGLGVLGEALRPHAGEQVVDVDARVPDVEVAHRGERADVLPVRASDLLVDRGALLLVEAAVTPGDGEARSETLDVPLERPGERLVEVVEAEDELAVGRGKAAEVRQMRITAELGMKPGARSRREIRRHQVRGATVERER